MNNDELIAAGHELAKCLDNEPLLDIAKMIVRLADKLDVTTAALREKTKQCEQLAAENAALKDYHPQPQGVAMMTALDAFFEHEDVPEQGMMAAFEILFCKQPETPATDAFIAEQRAQGVESGIKTIFTMMNHQAPGVKDSINVLEKHAAELRQGGSA
ncbi:hypothetical protein ACX4ER_003909 [Cronobacter dublinensis]